MLLSVLVHCINYNIILLQYYNTILNQTSSPQLLLSLISQVDKIQPGQGSEGKGFPLLQVRCVKNEHNNLHHSPINKLSKEITTSGTKWQMVISAAMSSITCSTRKVQTAANKNWNGGTTFQILCSVIDITILNKLSHVLTTFLFT